MRVVVVGAGICGLTAALRLVEAGHAVQVVAAAGPDRTTSSVAAALRCPYRALPREAVTRWSALSYDVLAGQLVDGRPVVHDYGHGGARVTLSYGCAADVVRLVADP